MHSGTTRLVDTDSLRHVNNAKYAYLAVDAVHAGLVAGAIPAAGSGGRCGDGSSGSGGDVGRSSSSGGSGSSSGGSGSGNGGSGSGSGRDVPGSEPTSGTPSTATPDETYKLFDKVETMSIAYTGQLHAGQPYRAHVWQDQSALQCEFVDADGQPMCFVAFGGAFPGHPLAAKL